MRVVAGKYGGRKLAAPKGRGVRPTLEKVREAVFDSLGPRFEGASVLDLFAGSGAMGFEALSRGAARVVFVDSEQRSLDAVRQNAAALKVVERSISLMALTASAAIRSLASKKERFDVVFVDPPWESGIYEQTLLELGLSGIVDPDGIVVVEHARRYPVDAVHGPLVMTRDRTYGDACVAYFRIASAANEPRQVED
ncbi:MAG TPA: 16S rRNA (guanine(966)-N(2))-methyltransferase RsmD [Myxococcota bacterium]|nr:16S rRNA (guanine(966)-N(2))-methyltransferase RsmD [Myxococcota bacterium]HPV03197.1 16S rRNA (guanine(966)-N(2))-methyltransferase RsmD [Myxococcota bacterium]